jgi:cytochrome c oxidase subunit 4
MSRQAMTLVGVWVGLMVLLTLTVAATFGPFGEWKPVINMVIAFCKAALIYWFFMHVREQGWLARLVAVAAIAWLMLLLGLTQADVLTRGAFSH